MDILGGLIGAALGALAAWQTKPKQIATKSVIGMMILFVIIGFVIGAYIL